jgi:hypothetical protein
MSSLVAVKAEQAPGIARLDSLMRDTWKKVLDGSSLVRLIREGASDRRLYALYLIETFHYASHNAKNQALVGTVLGKSSTRNMQYMKYCFKHALEEVGHEHMALHDLRSIGLNFTVDTLPAALPATEVFVSYLYRIATTGNPLQRLGYSFWAEDSYAFIGETMGLVAKQMGLVHGQMTFFAQHATIDEDHSVEVRDIISKLAQNEDDWNAIARVLETTLLLTGEILEAIAREYLNVQSGVSQRCVVP